MASNKKTIYCDTCKDTDTKEHAVVFCAKCQEFYCQNCYDCHRKLKATKSHHYAKFRDDDPGVVCSCDACKDGNKMAETICTDCRELLCKSCTNLHGKFKETKKHSILKLHTKTVSRNSRQVDGIANETVVTADGVGSDTIRTQRNGSFFTLESEYSYRPAINRTQPYTKQITRPSKGVFNRTFSVSSLTDKNESEVDRILALPNGRIIVVDKGNKKIKLFSPNYDILNEIIAPCSAIACIDDSVIAVGDGDTISRYSLSGNNIELIRGKSMVVYGFVRDLAYRKGKFITRLLIGETSLTYHGTKQIISQNRDSVDLMHFDSFADCIIQLSFYQRTATGYTLDGKQTWTVLLDGGPIAMTSVNGFTLVALHRGSCLITSQGEVLPSAVFSSDVGDINAVTWQESKNRLLLTTQSRGHVVVYNWSK